jgi:hypothetical protein
VPSNTILNSAHVPVVKESVEEVVPTTTLPLVAQDVQSVRIPESTPVPITTTTLPAVPMNRGIFSNINEKFRDRINALIAEIVDDVIEQTKNKVQSQVHSLG